MAARHGSRRASCARPILGGAAGARHALIRVFDAGLPVAPAALAARDVGAQCEVAPPWRCAAPYAAPLTRNASTARRCPRRRRSGIAAATPSWPSMRAVSTSRRWRVERITLAHYSARLASYAARGGWGHSAQSPVLPHGTPRHAAVVPQPYRRCPGARAPRAAAPARSQRGGLLPGGRVAPRLSRSCLPYLVGLLQRGQAFLYTGCNQLEDGSPGSSRHVRCGRAPLHRHLSSNGQSRRRFTERSSPKGPLNQSARLPQRG